MKYPITIQGIEFEDGLMYEKHTFSGDCGDMVLVRPCDDEYENKTFLGILLGDFALSTGARFDEEKKTLCISRAMYNPAIFVPDKNAVVFGCGSFWRKIDNASQMAEITDADINDIWYIKALKALDTKEANNEQ